MRCATAAMQGNLGETLTLDYLAHKAMFSKFHFSRLFLRATGVSPGRFLSALRLQEAKELLLTTDWNVVDIAIRVGYLSVGTFSTRFTQSVGMPPSEYRRQQGYARALPTHTSCGAEERFRVDGRVVLPDADAALPVFVGVFPSRIAQGSPISGMVVWGSERFSLDAIDSCHLLAFTIGARNDRAVTGGRTAMMAHRHLERGENTTNIELWMSPKDQLDVPVLLAMPDADLLVSRVQAVAA